MHLDVLDYIVFAGYIIAVLVIGYRVAHREKTTVQDYFLAGSNLPWYAIGFSMVAASISTEQFIGEVGYAYRYGIAVSDWEWGVMPSLTIMLLFFAPFYIRRRIGTMPEYLEYRYGSSTRIVFGLITVLSYAFINLSVVLNAGSLALNSIFDIPQWAAVLILVAVVGGYTIFGGLASTVWVDVLQSVLLLAAGIVVFAMGLSRIGSLEALRGVGERSHIFQPANHPALPWTGIMVVWFSTNTWYFASNQYINQRLLGAKNEWNARIALLFVAFLGIFLTLSVCWPGLIAYHLLPNLQDADKAYPEVVKNLFGSVGFGLKGLIFAGLMGAIASTMDSLVTSSSTVLTIDFYKRFLKKAATETEMVRFGRISAAAVLLAGALWSPMVGRYGSIFSYCQDCWVFMAIPITIVFVSAILWKRANNFAATTTLILSLPMTAIPFILPCCQQYYKFEINTFNLAGILILPVIIFHVIMAYLKPAPDPEKIDKWVWKPSMLFLQAEETVNYPWYKRILFWWIVMVIIYVCLFAYFW